MNNATWIRFVSSRFTADPPEEEDKQECEYCGKLCDIMEHECSGTRGEAAHAQRMEDDH